MPYYIFAWIAVFAYGAEVIIGKLTSKYSVKNPWLFNYIWLFFGLIFIIPVALINKITMPLAFDYIIYAAICNVIYNTLFTFALYKIDASVISPMFSFRVAFSALFAAVLLGEVFGISQYILIGIIFIAGLFVSIDEKMSIKSFFKPNNLLLLLAMVFLALMSVFLKKAMLQNGYWNATFWLLIFSQVFATVTIPAFIKDLQKITRRQLMSLLLVAVASFIGLLTSFKAFSVNVSISTAIISIPSSMIFAFILSIFVPKLLEKHTIKIYAIRFGIAAVMIISALLLSK
jgi:drug/metabolite transporter (DMT)-like permease